LTTTAYLNTKASEIWARWLKNKHMLVWLKNVFFFLSLTDSSPLKISCLIMCVCVCVCMFVCSFCFKKRQEKFVWVVRYKMFNIIIIKSLSYAYLGFRPNECVPFQCSCHNTNMFWSSNAAIKSQPKSTD
jgi:hypothetical protein